MEWQAEGMVTGEEAKATIEHDAIVDSKCPPPEVARRLVALRKLQLKHDIIEEQFYLECHALKIKYSKEHFEPLYRRRAEFIAGALEPTKSESECTVALNDDGDVIIPPPIETAAELKRGIPNFWLVTFLKDEVLKLRITEQDKLILKHLVDVRVELTPTGFLLQFEFEPNDYLMIPILTKEYTMHFGPEQKCDGALFDGPAIVSCKGCDIEWKENKEVATNGTHAKSFFDFFKFDSTTAADANNEHEASSIDMDFEIGRYFRDVIVPQAVRLFEDNTVNEDLFEDAEEYVEEEDLDYDPAVDREEEPVC